MAIGALYAARSSGRKGVYEYFYLAGISKNTGKFTRILKSFRSERFFLPDTCSIFLHSHWGYIYNLVGKLVQLIRLTRSLVR